MYEFTSICGLLTVIFPSQGFLTHTSPHNQWGTEWTENDWLAKMVDSAKLRV